MTAALRAEHLVAGYRHGRRRVEVLDVAEVSARRGELTAVVGPNGTGKSTLLRTLTGSLPPLGGCVVVDGEPIEHLARRERARRLAVVLTDRVDPGLLSVGELIALGRHPHTDWRGALDDHDRDIARRAAVAVGADDLWPRRFDELSDGQRQRCLIARALAQEPSVLVLDEPTAFLDLPGRVELTALLLGLARHGIAVIVSSHDLDLLLGHADRAWVVHAGTVIDGRPDDLVADGTLARAFPTVDITIDAITRHVTARARSLTTQGPR